VSLIASVQATPGQFGGTSGDIDTTGAKLFAIHVASLDVLTGVLDSKSLTWIPLTARVSLNAGRHSQWFYAFGTGGTGHNASVSGSGIYPVLDFLAYDGDWLFDVENGFGSSSDVSTIQPGSAPPAGNGGLFLAGFCAAAPAPALASIDSGFTIRQQTALVNAVNMQGGVADKTQTTGGAENPTWTLGDVSNQAACAIAVFKPAAAPPPTGWGQRLAGERNRRVRGL
jgi:hypothetical protein